MTRIGLISDTHGYMDEKIEQHLGATDEIWHAGDIGENNVLERLRSIKPTFAVFGNIETPTKQKELPETILREVDGLKFMMIHIAGKPGRYAKGISSLLKTNQPDVLICGHSHILKVERDTKHNLIFINPGAAGQQGFHKKSTLLRFSVVKGSLKNMEVIELGLRGRA